MTLHEEIAVTVKEIRDLEEQLSVAQLTLEGLMDDLDQQEDNADNA